MSYPVGPGGVIAERVVLSVADLTPEESAELGPLVQKTTHVVRELTQPSQVYVCLWSHMNREPGHIHFEAGEPPDDAEAGALAAAAHAIW